MEIIRDGDQIKFLNTDGISYETWLKLYNRINYLGYGLPSVNSLKEYFDRHIYLTEDQSMEVLKILFNEFKQENSYSKAEINKYNQKAKEKFGTTNDPKLAGYILTDGTLLRMSYDGYQRNIDHREIKDVLNINNSNSTSDAMIQFINFGNIRLNERNFEISQPPNDMQKPWIAAIIHKARNSDYQYMSIDIANNKGTIVKTFEYEFPSLIQIFRDIDDYFESIRLENEY